MNIVTHKQGLHHLGSSTAQKVSSTPESNDVESQVLLGKNHDDPTTTKPRLLQEAKTSLVVNDDKPNEITQKLFIVSNRLPITIRNVTKDAMDIERSSGGLATALSSTHNASKDSLWIGWPGYHTNDAATQARIGASLRDDYRCLPVYLNESDVQLYYEGFSNNALWPLFHYFETHFAYDEKEWERYVEINQRFCNLILSEASNEEEEVVVWIHDYHLFLLPAMLRKRLPEARIGFFLHIPFPASELFRVLPSREDLLQGLLGADLIGFQTFDYMQNFLTSVGRVLGVEAETHSGYYMSYGGRQVALGVHPIGIKPDKFLKAIHTDPDTAKELQQLHASISSRKLLLGMDRLDYSKGIPARLQAYRRFLDSHPEWREQVTFIQIAVPSREQVNAYQELKRQVDELVGEVNGVYGTMTWTPVQYVHRNLPFAQICALLRRADVALVTPLRDGMNLVAKEYVACQENKPGALIIGEFAGASSEMGEAFFVNPYDVKGMADRLYEVLTLPQDVLAERMSTLHKRVCTHTVDVWADKFLHALQKNVQGIPRPRPLSGRDRELLLEAALKAERRVFLLDYDGTLAALVSLPHLAAPSKEVLHVLQTLQRDPHNTVAVVSGRDRASLQGWLGGCGCQLAAEHGAWLFLDDGVWRPQQELQDDWKPRVKPLIQRVVDQTPGSSLEEKEYSLVWHYRMADPEFGLIQARELSSKLQDMLADSDIQVQNGHKVVEVKLAKVHKGMAATSIMEQADEEPADFILAIGDDRTDEDLFDALPPEQWTVKVGMGVSNARFFVPSPTEVLELLSDLTRVQQH